MVLGGLDDVKAKLRFHFHYKLTIDCPRVGCRLIEISLQETCACRLWMRASWMVKCAVVALAGYGTLCVTLSAILRSLNVLNER